MLKKALDVKPTLTESCIVQEAGSTASTFSTSVSWRELFSRRATTSGVDLMNEKYAEYLASLAWSNKRDERIAISHGRCAACGATKRIQVHHLTYERIFNEEMGDLLPLCKYDHDAAEELVRQGKLPRRGNVIFLATETIRLVLTYKKKLEKKHKQVKKPVPEAPSVAPVSCQVINGMVLLTRSMVRAAMTNRHGMNWKQLQLLGVHCPPKRNWVRRLHGTQIPKENWEQVLECQRQKFIK